MRLPNAAAWLVRLLITSESIMLISTSTPSLRRGQSIKRDRVSVSSLRDSLGLYLNLIFPLVRLPVFRVGWVLPSFEFAVWMHT